MQTAVASGVGVIGCWLLLGSALGCAPEAPPEDEVAATAELVSTAPVRTRHDLIQLMNSIERNMHQLDRLEGKLVGDFTALAAEAAKLDTAATALREAATAVASPAPQGLTPGGTGNQAALLQATKRMQEVQMSFNLQYLMLQQKMQDESRRFTLLSNIMKTKHDTAKNSISNIR
jgi:hypothetical protein